MKKYKSGTVIVESSEGTFHPLKFKVSGNGATHKKIEQFIREEVPSCGMMIFPREKF